MRKQASNSWFRFKNSGGDFWEGKKKFGGEGAETGREKWAGNKFAYSIRKNMTKLEEASAGFSYGPESSEVE